MCGTRGKYQIRRAGLDSSTTTSATGSNVDHLPKPSLVEGKTNKNNRDGIEVRKSVKVNANANSKMQVLQVFAKPEMQSCREEVRWLKRRKLAGVEREEKLRDR